MPSPRKKDPEKYCAHCGKKLIRKRYSGRLEDYGVFLRRKYCGLTCMGKARMKSNPTKSALLKRATKHRKPQCEQCGTTEMLNVHHIDGDQANNNPANLMTLCAGCHTKWHWEHGKNNYPPGWTLLAQDSPSTNGKPREQCHPAVCPTAPAD